MSPFRYEVDLRSRDGKSGLRTVVEAPNKVEAERMVREQEGPEWADAPITLTRTTSSPR